MNISEIRPYEAMGYVNIYRNSESSLLSGNTSIDDGRASEVISNISSYNSDVRARQNETSYDYAMRYDKDATYSLKGEDSDLASLDRVTDIPKQHKDSVLFQYQSFIAGKVNENRDKELVSNNELTLNRGSRQMEDFAITL